MEDLEGKFMECEIDPLLMVAIGTQESRLGKAYADRFNNEYHNPFGLSSGGKLIMYDSWIDSIDAECNLLKRLIGKGAINLDMLGATYAEDNRWPTKVGNMYLDLWDELEGLFYE